jgi:transcriptional regulator with XRE-family HTH domain
MTEQRETPGQVIVRLREERGWSTARLARLAGMHSQTLYKLEGGQRAPSLETARKIAAALGVSLAVFDAAEEEGQT